VGRPSSIEIAQKALREREPKASLLRTQSWAHWCQLAEIPPQWRPLVTAGVVVLVSAAAVATAHLLVEGSTERDRWLNALPLGLIVGGVVVNLWLNLRYHTVLVLSAKGLRRGPILAPKANRTEAVILVLATIGVLFLLGPSDQDRTSEGLARTLFAVAAGTSIDKATGFGRRLAWVDHAGTWVVDGPLIRWDEIERIEFIEAGGRITLVVVRNEWSSDPGRRVRIRLAKLVSEIEQVRAALEPYRPNAQAA
jgi:hypothetical protein